MSVNIALESDIDKELGKLKELIETLDVAKGKVKLIQFVGIKEVAELTGWSEKTVQELFNQPNFPCCDYRQRKKG